MDHCESVTVAEGLYTTPTTSSTVPTGSTGSDTGAVAQGNVVVHGIHDDHGTSEHSLIMVADVDGAFVRTYVLPQAGAALRIDVPEGYVTAVLVQPSWFRIDTVGDVQSGDEVWFRHPSPSGRSTQWGPSLSTSPNRT